MPLALSEFIDTHSAELIERCRLKVVGRSVRNPAFPEPTSGIPIFLGQLVETLRSENDPQEAARRALASAGQAGQLKPAERHVPAGMAAMSEQHGAVLQRQGYSIDQVVHDYGDLCQAITELAIESGAGITTDEFHSLNRCLDFAIADAVTGFAGSRDDYASASGDRAISERLGKLAHEQRNLLNSVMLSISAMRRGSVGIGGATAKVLDRSLLGLRDLIDRELVDVRLDAGGPLVREYVDVGTFITKARISAGLEARSIDRDFSVPSVEWGMTVHVDKQMLYSAVSNVLQHAFKVATLHGHVTLTALVADNRVLIEVTDEGGGRPDRKSEALSDAAERDKVDRSAGAPGLSIARRAIAACGGELRVKEVVGTGCVFTIDLPREERE